jgi:integrase
MLFRLVRPVRRSGSSIPQFAQRIPADVRARAVGLKLTVPIGDETVLIAITPRMDAVRCSLRTRDPSIAKVRQAQVAAHLEHHWRSLRQKEAVSLTHKQATALAGGLYHAWAGGEGKERTTAVVHTPSGFVVDAQTAEEEEAAFGVVVLRLKEAAEREDLEAPLGSIVDRLLRAKGIGEVDPQSRAILLTAFYKALVHAFELRQRNAAGDYSPDPNAERFPEWRGLDARERSQARGSAGRVSFTGLVEEWWREAQATGKKPSTYESYRNTLSRFAAFLEHDDARRVTAEDVIGFKDHRLASTYRGRRISAKTVKDNDLAGLKTIFGWAVTNRRLPDNPAAGVTLKVGKRVKLRSKGFSEPEARAILTAALRYQAGRGEQPRTVSAKRWVPWLCAYTGARVGEMAQLRKQDLRREGAHWVLSVTPEAGTVKNNEARDLVLHPHLAALGFPKFVQAATPGHLFLKPHVSGNVRGPLRGLKNRLAEFARSVVKDRNVAPNHGWRHRFKTIGMEAGIDHRVLDAIQGQSARSTAETYGDVTVKTMAAAMKRIPRINTA